MHKFYDEVSKITPNLYLTNGYSIHASGLSKLGINLVINVTKDLDFQTKNSEGAIINARVPVDDNVQANLLPYFQVHTLRWAFTNYVDKKRWIGMYLVQKC